jgi:hypothetical protein
MLFEYTVGELQFIRVDYFPDFDGDDNLNKNDLEQAIRYLTRDELNEDEILFIVDRVRVDVATTTCSSILIADYRRGRSGQ